MILSHHHSVRGKFFLHILDKNYFSNNSSFILSRACMFAHREHRLLCVVSKKGSLVYCLILTELEIGLVVYLSV